jgi:hypothetical protein
MSKPPQAAVRSDAHRQRAAANDPGHILGIQTYQDPQ